MKITKSFDDAIASLKNGDSELEEIHLNGQSLSKDQWQQLLEALKINAGRSPLKKLDLTNTGLDHQTAKILSDFFLKGSIEIINAGDNDLGIIGAAFLLQIPSLKMLNLAANGIGSAASPLNESVAISPSLQYLDLSLNELSDTKSTRVFTKSLSSAPSLAYLKAGSNELGSEGTIVLATIIKGLFALQGIELPNNDIDDKAILVLVENLTKHKELRILNLSNNSITSNGATALARLLTVLSKLQELDLSYNRVDDKGAESFAVALAGQISLEHLNLSANRIGDQGAMAIARSLLTNNRLVLLNLAINPIMNEMSFQAFTEALEENHALLRLELIYRGKTAEFKSQITNKLTRNLAILQRSTHNWMRAILVISFIRANEDNVLKNSILPLTVSMMTYLDSREKRFIDSPATNEEKFQALLPSDTALTTAELDIKNSDDLKTPNSQPTMSSQQANPTQTANDLSHQIDEIKENIKESEVLAVLRDAIKQTCNKYKRAYHQITISVWHRHGETGQTRASNFHEKIKKCTNLKDALNLLYKHLSRTEWPFNNTGRLYNHSFDTFLLQSIADDAILSSFFHMTDVSLKNQIERENARKNLLTNLLIYLAPVVIRGEAPPSVIITGMSAKDTPKSEKKGESKKDLQHAELKTNKTAGHGDYGFHATLGVWSDINKQYECMDIKQCREKLSKAICDAKKGDKISNLVNAGIQALVMGDERIQGLYTTRQ